jgi:tetratricopeptide (TPR) repeat protein
MKVKVLIILLSLLITNGLYSQKTIREYEADGDAYFKSGRYYPAVESYRNALKFDTTNTALAYKYAEALSRSLNYCKAAKWYEAVILQADTFTYTDCLFKLAVARKNCGDYHRAKADFERLLSHSSDIKEINSLKPRIEHELSSVEFAIKHINDTVIYTVEHLPAPVNTPFSEFNPVEIPGNRLVYSSYTTMFTDSFQNIFSQFYISRILTTRLRESGWNEPEEFGNKINSNRYLTANICFANRYRTIYFTRCYDRNGMVGNCRIFTSEKTKGKWSKPKELPASINLPGSSATQPYLAEGKDYDILYFVSDRDGGYGKNDIWYSILKNGEYQEPSNLGNVINTEGNEMTPYYDTKNRILYFSSDWHDGFGGFDIFKSEGGLNQWKQPVNMGIPVNSENNDLYFTPGHNGTDAYFSSNRIGSFYSEGTTYCCSDIYYVTIEKKAKDSVDNDTTPPPVISTRQKIIDLLPITLYFDNDIPDPNTTSDTTISNYKDLLDRYFDQKEKYEKRYSRGLRGAAKNNAVDTINDFFDNYVGAGFRKLETLVTLLKTELDSGKDVRLMIEGYASPLNTPEYNYHLSKRRIASLVNYLYTVDNGYFVPYLTNKEKSGGSITIFSNPLGDSKAAPYVSSNPNDKRNSVYSKAAALERRIKITRYDYGNSEKNAESAEIKLKSNIINAGSIKQGENKSGIIGFTNTGTGPLEKPTIETDCNCIQVRLKKEKVNPGGNGSFAYLIGTTKLKKGVYSQIITIKYNGKTTLIQLIFKVI